MSLTKFTDNINIISQLPDAPTMTAEELKAKFDEAGTKIKSYLNTTLTTETEQLVATEKTTLQGLITALGTQIRSEISAGVQARYPVGKIILDTENTNPATYLGFGTWQLWGQGRVPVGVNSEDTDFNEAEKTGGEKTHSHKFKVDAYISKSVTASNGARALNYDDNSPGSSSETSNLAVNVNSILGDGSAWNYNDATRRITNGTTQAVSNIQPYITCYMWKRVS